MISVGGREVILRNIDWLRSQGFDQIIINLHYHGEAVVDLVGNGSVLGVSVAYSREPELLGTAGGILAARSLIGSDTFLVVYADNLFDVQLSSVVAEHHRSGATATMVLFERDDVTSSGVAVLGVDGWITEFQEKPLPGTERSHWVNAGLLVCGPRLYETIPAAGPSDLSRDVMPVLARLGQSLRAYCLAPEERIMWIDTMADLQRTEAMLVHSSDLSGS
jgi:mannose-1-phosphate guanylyltransferase/mannose-1-phosphate guanylyltransferase/phosphomannomutase